MRFQYGLMGLPYWQILLDCLGQCIERVCFAQGKRLSHYVHLVLFARRVPSGGERRAACATRKDFSSSGPPEGREEMSGRS